MEATAVKRAGGEKERREKVESDRDRQKREII